VCIGLRASCRVCARPANVTESEGSGKPPTYNLTGNTETKPVTRQGSRIAFQQPFGEPSAVFEGDTFTATLEGQFVDYWERVH